jgi:hypothetical protein
MSIDDKKQNMPIIMNSGFTGTLTNNVYGGGSIVGAAVGKIYNCFSKGNLIFPSSTTGGNGGLVGVLGLDDYDHSSIILENSYFAGNINSSSSREVGTLVGKLGSNKESNKYTLIKNSYSTANLNGNNVGLIGISFMNGENLFNGGQITGYSNSGNIVGNLGPNTTFNNVHSITQKGYITNKMGSQITSVKSSYLRENVKLGNGFKYDSESYPLLYKRNSDGSYSDELLENQGKINLK